jgi:hypothetical protein
MNRGGAQLQPAPERWLAAGAEASLSGCFRPSTPEDAPQILALFAEAGLHPNARPEDLDWKYWQDTGDWPGARSFVLTDALGGIVAHGNIIASTLASEDRRLRVIRLVDWAARPRCVGAGAALLKQIGRHADVLLATGGSRATRQILPVIGFRPLCEVTGYVRPLHPLGILRAGRAGGRRLAPRFARSLLWRLRAPTAAADGWRARRIGPLQLPALASVLPRPRPGLAVFERSESLFRHILKCPFVASELHGLEQGGRLRGYFLLTFAPGQARLADLWLDSDEPADWRALILCAVREAMRREQAIEIIAWASTPGLRRRFLECGFHARNTQPVQALPRGALENPVTVYLQLLDSDQAYLHHGRVELWS